MRQPRQWDVWWACLREGVKGEQTGDHNVLVVSNNFMNEQSGVVIVAPITTTGSEWPWVVAIEPADAWIKEPSWIECHQLLAMTCSPKRFVKFRKRLAEEKRARVALAVRSALGQAITWPLDQEKGGAGAFGYKSSS